METKKDQHKEGVMNNMDKRLEAIKEIIVGNNFEKIEAKISRITHNLEQTNGRVIDVVEQLSEELSLLRENFGRKIDKNDKKSFEDDEAIRNKLFALKTSTEDQLEKLEIADEDLSEAHRDLEKDLHLKHDMLEKDVEQQLDRIQDELEQYQRPLLNKHEEALARHASTLEKLEKNLEEQDGRISALTEHVKKVDRLEETLQSIKEDFSNGLNALSEEVKSLKQNDERLYNSLAEETEDRKTDMEQLEARVANHNGEIKAYLSERSRAIAARQEKIEERMEGLDDRLIGLHDLIEDDVFKYFEDLKHHKKENRKRLQEMQKDFYNQMDETLLRLEGRIDGLMESNTREIKKLNKKVKNKESLKRTIERLGDLLDD